MLDSKGLVNLVVAVEQAIEDELEESVMLADDRALARSSRAAGTWHCAAGSCDTRNATIAATVGSSAVEMVGGGPLTRDPNWTPLPV